MRFGMAYYIFALYLLIFLYGTANAHPHKSGQMNHGPSLESYGLDLYFNTAAPKKTEYDINIIITKKDQSKKGLKNKTLSKTKSFYSLEKKNERTKKNNR